MDEKPDKVTENIRKANKLSYAAIAAWLIAHGIPAERVREAEVPQGSAWAVGGEMLAKDAVSKKYEVGGNVRIKSGTGVWTAWNKGEVGRRVDPFDLTQLSEIGSDETVCRIHTHTLIQTVDRGGIATVPTNPPGVGDMLTLLQLSTDIRMSFTSASKLRSGVFDSIGFWSYGVNDLAELRRRVPLQQSLQQAVQEMEPQLLRIREAWLTWVGVGRELYKNESFMRLSNEEKVATLKERGFAALEKAYREAGFYLRYDATETALKQPPCLKPGE